MTGPFHLDAEFDAVAFCDALDRAGYTAAGIKSLKRDLKSNEGVDVALLDRRTSANGDPFHIFGRLFFVGREVAEAALREAVAPLPLESLVAVGLVREEDGKFRAVARIERHGELFVCSDFVSFTREVALDADHVLGVGPGAISLAALCPQSSVESVLDVGTGGGIHALLAAPHAERVVATDICARALNFGEMNARLNGITNIEFRAGSFFEPANGELFDRIVSNPPFVISPASRFVYRDGGLGGDAVSEHIVRAAAEHLEENGCAVVLVNWHHSTGDDWEQRPASWTRGNGCDVRWMRFDDQDPLTYAASWLRQEERRDVATAARLLDEWVRHYDERGMARIATGAVVMRKRTCARNWERCEDIPMDISMNACGEQMERIFDAEDLLQSLAHESDLLECRFKLHPAHRLEQRMAVRGGAWALESNKLHLTSGMDFCAQIDMPTMQFLGELDGNRTVREAATPVAEAMGRTVEDVVPVCLGITKRMLRIGLLMRA